MELLIGAAIVGILWFWYSMRSRTKGYQAFSALDAATPWFERHGLSRDSATFSSYSDPGLVRNVGATVLAGVAQDAKGESVGFAIEVVPRRGVVDGRVLIPSGIATWHKRAAMEARLRGLRLIDVLEEYERAHAKRITSDAADTADSAAREQPRSATGSIGKTTPAEMTAGLDYFEIGSWIATKLEREILKNGVSVLEGKSMFVTLSTTRSVELHIGSLSNAQRGQSLATIRIDDLPQFEKLRDVLRNTSMHNTHILKMLCQVPIDMVAHAATKRLEDALTHGQEGNSQLSEVTDKDADIFGADLVDLVCRISRNAVLLQYIVEPFRLSMEVEQRLEETLGDDVVELIRRACRDAFRNGESIDWKDSRVSKGDEDTFGSDWIEMTQQIAFDQLTILTGRDGSRQT